MKTSECDIMDEIYTHIDDETGEVRHFNATRMAADAFNAILRGKAKLLTAAMDYDFVDFIKAHRGIEPYKVNRLVEPYLSAPLIGVVIGDSVLTVDGHHRLVRLANEGADTYSIYVFNEDAYSEYLITDISYEDEECIVDIVKEQKIFLPR